MHQALFIAIRLTMLLLGVSLLTLATTTLDLTDGFERLLEPFKRFGLPAHELSMMMGIALRFLPQFAIELRTIYRAQISRGANFGKGPKGGVAMMTSLIVPLFTSAFRHAETLSLGMDARCYHGGENRTRLKELSFSKRDIAGTVYLGIGTGDRPRLEHATVNTKPCTSPLPHSCKSQPSKENQHASVKPQTANASKQ